MFTAARIIRRNNDILNHVQASPDRMNIVSIEHCSRTDYSTDSDTKAVEGIFLFGRHFTQSSAFMEGNTPKVDIFGNRRRGNGPTYVKQTTQKSYDRIFFYGDTSSRDGRCFAVIIPSTWAAEQFMSEIKLTGGVGDIFVIYEPKPVTDMMGVNLPVLVPNNFPAFPLKHRNEYYPEVPLRANDEKARAFLLPVSAFKWFVCTAHSD